MKRYVRSSTDPYTMKLFKKAIAAYNRECKESRLHFQLNDSYFRWNNGSAVYAYGKIQDLCTNFVNILADASDVSEYDLVNALDEAFDITPTEKIYPGDSYYIEPAEDRIALDDKYGFLSKSRDFYSQNAGILANVLEIAACGRPISDVAGSLSLDGTLRNMVKIKGDDVYINGPLAWQELASFIIRCADSSVLFPNCSTWEQESHQNACTFSEYDQKRYPEMSKFVFDKLDEIIKYLQSLGITCNYDRRRHGIHCVKSTFPAK